MILFFMSIISLFIIIYINYKDLYYCRNWDRGLNNTYILNDKSIFSCSINIPKKKCLIDILSPFLDFSRILNIKCGKRNEEEKFLLKKTSKKKNIREAKIIGYPITIGDSEEIVGHSPLYSFSLYNYVMNNLINMDDKEQLDKLKNNKKPEVFLDYTSNPYGELKIKINKKEKLSKERKNLEKKSQSNNIIFIFLDNLSRVHFYRQYKKTSEFLKKFLKYEGFSTKSNEQKYHGFEFMKYHKIGHATLHNAIPMFSGVYFRKNYRMINIGRDLKKLGYITCNVQDICHKELMGISRIKNYTYSEFDHEYAGPNCDPTIYACAYGLFKGENSVIRKCFYGKEIFEYSLEYSRQFWMAYKLNKKFLRIVNTYAHDYSGEKSKYIDNLLFKFLNNLYNSNLLRNTTVFLAGDHGFALMGIYKLLNANDWKMEVNFPFFALLVPDLKNLTYEEQYSNIIKNQQNLITPFDIYYTIRHIIYGNKYKMNLLEEQNNEGESLFKYINPKERNCSKYKDLRNCECLINKS